MRKKTIITGALVLTLLCIYPLTRVVQASEASIYNFDEEQKVEDAFFMAKRPVSFTLWQQVLNWATSDERGPNKYNFKNAGPNNGFKKDEPVSGISWRDMIVWCNAFTEYYNTVTQNSDRDCVYLIGGGIIRDSDMKNSDWQEITFDPIATGYRLPTSKEWEHLVAQREEHFGIWEIWYDIDCHTLQKSVAIPETQLFGEERFTETTIWDDVGFRPVRNQ